MEGQSSPFASSKEKISRKGRWNRGKKKQSVMDIELPRLHKAIVDNGHDKKAAHDVIELIKPFVGYGFNKSHAAAYAFIAYQCAYLKHHYPIEFYTALLSVFAENEEKAAHYIADARRHGFDVLAPLLNEAQGRFSINEKQQIVYGFESMKGLRDAAIEPILENRPFATAEDLILTIPKKLLSKTSVEGLVLSGGMDEFLIEGEERIVLLDRLMKIRGSGEMEPKEIASFTHRKKLELEKKYLGAYLSGHPLDEIARPVDWEEASDNQSTVTAIGIVDTIRRIITKKGDPMAFITITFLEQDLDAVCFPNLWESDIQFRKGDPIVPLSDILREGMLVKTTGTYEVEESKKSFLLNHMSIPVRQNKGFEDFIENVQNEVGILPPVQSEESIQAPVTNFDSIMNY